MRKKGQLAKQANAKVAEIRVAETAAMLLNFKSRRDITDYLTSTYGIQKRSCDNIITHAYEYIRNNYPVDRESIVITHLEFYYNLAQQWKDVDPRASLKALEQVERLLKLHQEVPLIQQNTLNMNFDKITNEQLTEAIESIRQAKQQT
jgi:hypothetical protein